MLRQPVIKTLQFRNLLSFGEQSESLELGPLNVLIGPNGSGKSNLIEVISLLQNAPRELVVPVREGGGIRDWLWKGTSQTPTAKVEVTLDYPPGPMSLRYRLCFTEVGQRLEVTDERLENESAWSGHQRPYFYFGYENGRPMLAYEGTEDAPRGLRREDIDPQQSILSQRKDPELYPQLTYVGRLFGSFRLYREWSFGRNTAPRRPQPADLRNDFLEEDASNLGLVLNRLRKDITAKRGLLENLKTFYEDAEDLDVIIEGGSVQVFLQERNHSVPATRLSDGTLRWISLLAILLHPSPPPLVCIEEPELGLHPDMMPTLARLLRDASERMQLIVTTHSDALVDALNETPEAIVVTEKVDGASTLKRLSREDLSIWLEKYTLGQLWRSGEIGGNRW